jgi:hypothetical protein
MSYKNDPNASLEVIKSVDVSGSVIELGVLRGGIPFLSGRGLAKACGISNSTLVNWGEFTPQIGESNRAGKMANLLAFYGYEGDKFFFRVPNGIMFGEDSIVCAYPAQVCMAFLDYYCFEVNKEEARNSFRVLGGRQLPSFIYEATGYDPHRPNLPSWQHFHDRLLLNRVPSGYFSVFQETASVVLNAIRSGLIFDEHTVPDISMGKIWAKYWTDNGLAERYGNRVPHLHIYPEYFPQSLANGSIKAHIYPCVALGEFRQWLDFEYIPKKFPSYLKSKVKQGVISSGQVMGLLQAVRPLELPGDSKTA